MGADGAIRPNFHWVDPGDERDVVEVLTSEGITLRHDGTAEPAQRIGSEELAEFIATPDPDQDPPGLVEPVAQNHAEHP